MRPLRSSSAARLACVVAVLAVLFLDYVFHDQVGQVANLGHYMRKGHFSALPAPRGLFEFQAFKKTRLDIIDDNARHDGAKKQLLRRLCGGSRT
jgi:hypothetical protein